MNAKYLVLIALALCLCVSFPVSAIWHNGNWVSENVTEGYTVIHGAESGVDSKYRPTPQLVEGRSEGDSMQ